MPTNPIILRHRLIAEVIIHCVELLCHILLVNSTMRPGKHLRVTSINTRPDCLIKMNLILRNHLKNALALSTFGLSESIKECTL